MLLYVKESLILFNHAVPRTPQDQPHPQIKPKYGQKGQYTKEEDASPPLNATKNKLVQEVLGVFLYYGRAIDMTVLTALGNIATQQAAPNENTMRNVHQFFDYAATHPDAIITFHTSDMVLAGHSDASYLSESKAYSRVGGHSPLSNNSRDPPNNGAVLNITQIIKYDM